MGNKVALAELENARELVDTILKLCNTLISKDIPRSASEALEDAWELSIEELGRGVSQHYPMEDRKADKKRIISMPKAVRLMQEYELEMVQTFEKDVTATTLAKSLLALTGTVGKVASFMYEHARGIGAALFTSILGGVKLFGHLFEKKRKVQYRSETHQLVLEYYTVNFDYLSGDQVAVDIEKAIQAWDTFEEYALEFCRGIASVTVMQIAGLASVEQVTKDIFKAIKIRDKYVEKIRDAAMPQRENVKRYRRRKTKMV